MISLSLLLNLLGTLADRTAPLDDWRLNHQKKLASLQGRSDQIEAVTLGNSHSEAIDYSILGIQGQSLAFAAADLFEVEQYAAALPDRLPQLKTVFIAISYYSFRWDNAELASSNARRIRFYSMVPVWSPIEGDLTNFALGKMEASTHVMSVVRSDNWKGVWVGLFSSDPAPGVYVYDGVTTSSIWGECSHYTAEQLDPHAQHVAGRNVSDATKMANAHPGLEEDAYAALARTIEQLQSQGIRVVLFTPAYHETYNRYFTEGGSDILDHMRRAVGELQKTYGMEYYDFSTDPDFPIHPELFFNSDHLGDCGQRVLTLKLLELLDQKNQMGK